MPQTDTHPVYIPASVEDLKDGDVFSLDGGKTWHICAVVLFGSVAVYCSRRRDEHAPTVRVDADRDLPVIIRCHHADTVIAAPYDARRCPDCDTWIYTAAGPFAEDDPTKTMADFLHWSREHATEEERTATCVGFPFFDYNEAPVSALREPTS
jgi:hypothetical protein